METRIARSALMRFLIAATLLAGIAQVAAADLTEDESLKGMSGVMVIIERLHPDAGAIGLERETLDAVVRDALQKNNVRILSPEERAADERRPYLYVNCNVMDMKNPALVAFSLDIEVHQRVTLASGDKAQGLTWAKSYLGIQSADKASEHILHVAEGYVEQFIAAYRKQNPPNAPSAATPAPAPAPAPAEPAPAPTPAQPASPATPGE